jgi:Domain of unknown function (DUF4136)
VKWIVGLMGAALVTSASAKVTVDHDKSADFSARRTYAWVKGTEAPNQLVEKRIHDAVDEQLRAKGLTRVEGEADLHVTTHATTSTGGRLDVTSYGYGGYVGWDGFTAWTPGTGASLRAYTTGTLVVDLVDPAGNKLMWRGVAAETLGINPNPEKVTKKILKVTRVMFRDFPPPASGTTSK